MDLHTPQTREKEAHTNEVLHLISQYLTDLGYTESAQCLQRQSKIFFDLDRFKAQFLAGKWGACRDYVQGFLPPAAEDADSHIHDKLLFILSQQKFLSALARHEPQVAIKVFKEEMKPLLVGGSQEESIVRDYSSLLLMEDLTKSKFAKWQDDFEARNKVFVSVKTMLQESSLFGPILELPEIEANRLKTILNRGITWQIRSSGGKKSDKTFVGTLYYDETNNDGKKSRRGDEVEEPEQAEKPPAAKSQETPKEAEKPAKSSKPKEADTPAPASSKPTKEPTQKISSKETSKEAPPAVAPKPKEKESTTSSKATTREVITKEVSTKEKSVAPKPTSQALPLSKAVAPKPKEKEPEPAKDTDTTMTEASEPVHSTKKRLLSSPPPEASSSKRPKVTSTVALPIHKLIGLDFEETIHAAAFHPKHPNVVVVCCGTNYATSNLQLIKLAGTATPALNRKIDLDTDYRVQRTVWSEKGNHVALMYRKCTNFTIFYTDQGTTFEVEPHWEIATVHEKDIQDVCFTRIGDTEILATCSEDSLKLWNVATGVQMFELQASLSPSISVRKMCCFCCKVKGDDLSIVATTVNSEICLFHVTLAQFKGGDFTVIYPTNTFQSPFGVCGTVQSCPKTDSFFSCGKSQNSLVEWELDGRVAKIITKFNGFNNPTQQNQVPALNYPLIAICDGLEVKYWDAGEVFEGAVTVSKSHRVHGPGGVPIKGVSFNSELSLSLVISPKGEMVTIFSPTFTKDPPDVKMTDPKIEEDLPPPSQPDVRSLVFDSQVNLAESHGGPVKHMIFSHSGSSLLTMDWADAREWQWKDRIANATERGEPKQNPITVSTFGGISPGQVSPAACLANNDSYLVMGCGGTLGLYNNQTRKLMAPLVSPSDKLQIPTTVSFDPSDNNYLGIGTLGGTVIIRWCSRARSLWSFECHTVPTPSCVTDILYKKTRKEKGYIWTAAFDSIAKWELTMPTDANPTPQLKLIDRVPSDASDEQFPSYIRARPKKPADNGSENEELLVVWKNQLKRYQDSQPIVPICDPWIADATINCADWTASGEHIIVALDNHELKVLAPNFEVVASCRLPSQVTWLVCHPKTENVVALGNYDGAVIVVQIPKY